MQSLFEGEHSVLLTNMYQVHITSQLCLLCDYIAQCLHYIQQRMVLSIYGLQDNAMNIFVMSIETRGNIDSMGSNKVWYYKHLVG